MRFGILLLFLMPLNIHAQSVLSNSGAKNEALGSTVSTAVDEWALWRNPAGLASIKQPSVSSSIRGSQASSALTKSAVFATSFKFGSAGLGIGAFGDDIYNESLASLGFANTLGLASIGVRADLNQLRIDGNSTRRTFGLTIGCTAKISSKLSIGICARNVNLPTWSDHQPLPVVLNAGLSYTPGDNFMVAADVEKNTDFDPTFKGGFEYSMRKRFFCRTGFNLFPHAAFGGIGLRMWRLGVDYALRYGYLPGYSQQLSITIRLRQ